MARAQVGEHTRTLANGTHVEVHSHSRAYTPGAGDTAPTPVQAMRADRLREAAKERRAESWHRGKQSARKGWEGVKKRGRQSGRMALRGGKRLHRAGQLAGRHKKAAAVMLAVGGVAEVGAGLLWSTSGAVFAGLSILTAMVGGGLMIGGSKRSHAGSTSPKAPRPARPSSMAGVTTGVLPAPSNAPKSKPRAPAHAGERAKQMNQ